MYVASVMSGANNVYPIGFMLVRMSGANNVYPIGFMLVRGNKDGSTWTSFLTLLKEACPIFSTQRFHDSVEGMEFSGAFLDYQHPFLFVSDRDKGLKPALQAVFPRNFAVSYAKHIDANVCQR